MPDVKNSAYANANPTNPAAGYDKEHGEYQDTEVPLTQTATESLPMSQGSDPWKNVSKGGNSGE